MGYKIFVSYKYKDTDVAPLPEAIYPTWCKDYVNRIEKRIIKGSGHIYKGEEDGEDLSYRSESYIWEHLKDKIRDSTLTIVLISPNMKEPGKWERSQWIPWEISYSLKNIPRNDRISRSNAILAVILPNRDGSYGYYDEDSLFPILRENIENGYAHVTYWSVFEKYPDYCISKAFANKEATPSHKIAKSL